MIAIVVQMLSCEPLEITVFHWIGKVVRLAVQFHARGADVQAVMFFGFYIPSVLAVCFLQYVDCFVIIFFSNIQVYVSRHALLRLPIVLRNTLTLKDY